MRPPHPSSAPTSSWATSGSHPASRTWRCRSKASTAAPIKDGDKEIAAANYPKIRLLLQTKRTAAAPIGDTDNVWTLCTPETAKDFSAVAYFFGRKIHQEENVPIGLIDTTWGGTPAHAWISSEGIGWANLDSVALDGGRIARVGSDADAIRENQKIQDEQMKAAGKTPPTHPRNQGDPYKSWTPSTLYNGMVAPFVNYTVKGFLWYQGETDHEGLKALSYSRVFPALIQDWRKQWGEGPLPFFYVQLASYKSDEGFSIVRDAQRRTLELVNTGMAVTLDVGMPTNIHPPDKQTVGGRLAQSALGIAYGHKIETASPSVRGGHHRRPRHPRMVLARRRPEDERCNTRRLRSGRCRRQVGTRDSEDRKDRSMETVVATAPGIPAPQKIRYGWNGVVTSYLYNAGGLPMGTFTSESDAQMLAR